MEVKCGGNVAVKMIKEREKFLMAMTRLALSNHRAVEYVECREQRRRAVAKIIVGHPFEVAQPHWQHRLSTFQRLHLALLVHTQHQSLVGRVEVKANHVAHFLYEERVGR